MNFESEYFKDRPFEDKYWKMSFQWLDYTEPKNMIDIGCGLGYYIHCFNYYDIPAEGYEISKFAVENAYGLAKGKVHPINDLKKKAELVLCIDVLEHIPIEDIDQIIDNIVNTSTKWIICSICMAGDPMWKHDKTHVTKRTKGWWINQFVKRNYIFLPTPKHFLFGNQILIFRKNKG